MTDLIVIGGGAAGMFAAIEAARAGLTVEILERNAAYGRKLAMTGNGQCNYTNLVQDPSCYRSDDPALAYALISRFDTAAVVDWFSGIGIEPEIRRDGFYPRSHSAKNFAQMMEEELAHLGVRMRREIFVRDIRPEEDHFSVETIPAPVKDLADHREKRAKKKNLPDAAPYCYTAKQVLVAAGGKACPETGSDGSVSDILVQMGIAMKPAAPALTALIADSSCLSDGLRELAGIRMQGRITLPVSGHSERGELQFTEYGVSGIPAMQLSRFVGEALEGKSSVPVVIDLIPDATPDELLHMLRRRKEKLAYKKGKHFFDGYLPDGLIRYLLKQETFSRLAELPVAELQEDHLRQFVQMLKFLTVPVTGLRDFPYAQTTAGGVLLTEVDEQMMSRKIPGLYFAGEILDVDGTCGGYNLHWAWASAHAAAEGIVHRKEDQTV